MRIDTSGYRLSNGGLCLVKASELEFVAMVILQRQRYFLLGKAFSLETVAAFYKSGSKCKIGGPFERNIIKTTYGVRANR